MAQVSAVLVNDQYSADVLKRKLGNCGLGLRYEFLEDLIKLKPKPVSFLEVAPENWLHVGGKRGKLFQAYSEQYPIACHGLSLSIGGPSPIDRSFVNQLKSFFSQHNIAIYSEHLSYCSDYKGQLYDLMPMPFTEEAVHYVAKRIIQVQDILERQIALENISYYAAFKGDLTEAEFIQAILTESNCLLLLDVNNVYVNSINHRYNPYQFLDQMLKAKIAYLHIAGHWQKSEDLLIDTHGDVVVEPVWHLLDYVYQTHGIIPTLLERDNDVPPLKDLLKETERLKEAQVSLKELAYDA
ncbi:DUF692 domain-containing protein [Thiotrichales bacterium 19S11-10]|nr:DUF692 domain-containing protein [Thiotrichales bacterium 19S11-10]